MNNDKHEQAIASARAYGYNDAYYDRLYLLGQLACKCARCRAAYDEGQRQALADLMVSE